MFDPVLQSIFNRDDRLAVIDEDIHCSFEDLKMASRILAGRLNHLDLSHGGRISVILPNSLCAVIAFLAVAQTGHSYLPLNIGLKPVELKNIFHKCKVQAVICLASMQSLIPEGTQVVIVDEGPPGAQDEPSTSNEYPQQLIPAREFVCLSTSGSSGDPRIVARTALAIHANLRQVASGLQVTAEDRFLSVVPFWHANGFSNCLLLPLFCGASIVTMERFLPRPMLKLILNKKPSVVIGSPFVFRALAQVIESHSQLGHVRAWISSGAALPAELDKKLRALNIHVQQLYGSSETGTISISAVGQKCAGNVGKPLDDVNVRLVDDSNHVVAQGQPGNIQVSGSALFSGYIGEPESKINMTEDGFYRTGDIGMQDMQGNLTLKGRSDAIINISGIKVDPMEIQQVLTSMPGIEQALVFGSRDTTGLEIIKVLLVTDGKIRTDEVFQYCRSRLAEYKLPRTIKLVDKIPQDLMGKSARKLLDN